MFFLNIIKSVFGYLNILGTIQSQAQKSFGFSRCWLLPKCFFKTVFMNTSIQHIAFEKTLGSE